MTYAWPGVGKKLGKKRRSQSATKNILKSNSKTISYILFNELYWNWKLEIFEKNYPILDLSRVYMEIAEFWLIE